MTHIEIDGKLVARFLIRDLQSWNDVFGGGHWRRGQSAAKRWRLRGEMLGLRWRMMQHLPSVRVNVYGKDGKLVGHYCEPIAIQKRVLLIIRVVRGTERKYDIHNVFIKALLDGFSDAGLWHDDEWAYVPMVLFTWAKDAQGRGKHFVVEIHELGRFTENGVAQILPTGEKRRGYNK